MENIGYKRLLERAIGVVNVSELVTDASSTIIKMIRKLKGRITFNMTVERC
jgi:hypothetical protein